MWKGTIDILLRLTQKEREVDLPEIWHVWANCKKEERVAVLQEQFRKMARELKLPVPVATPELVATIFNLKFAAAYEDKLEHGLQPFLVTYLSQKNVSEQQDTIEMHRLMTEGTPTLLDLVDLKAAAKISLPTKESQMLRTCRAFGVVLAVICGTRAPIYRNYRLDILDRYDSIQPLVEELAEVYNKDLVYAQILRWLQLRFQEYWSELEYALDTVPPPRFSALYEAIRYKQWQRPPLPDAYLFKGKVGSGSGLRDPIDRRAGTDAGGGAPPGGGPTDGKHTYVRNPNPDASYLSIGSQIGKLNVYLKKVGHKFGSIPKDDKGNEMCLAYHLKGGCYEDCARAIGHHLLSRTEHGVLGTFMKKGTYELEEQERRAKEKHE
jgi:hypothetical protein